MPLRPAGGVWTSAHDLSKYVQMELAKGVLPNGKRLVSEENLLARRVPQVLVGEDVTYGMGLIVDTQLGHPGRAPRRRPRRLPERHDVAARARRRRRDPHELRRRRLLRGPFLRRLLEVLFDGKPEAGGAARGRRRAEEGRHRQGARAPRRPGRRGRGRQARAALRERGARRADGEEAAGGAVVFDFGEWQSAVASRKNDDGTISFITIDPTIDGFEFVVADTDGKRALVIRDAQHEYVFTEETGSKSTP